MEEKFDKKNIFTKFDESSYKLNEHLSEIWKDSREGTRGLNHTMLLVYKNIKQLKSTAMPL